MTPSMLSSLAPARRGLAVSHELKHLGLRHAVLERGDSVGYTWAHLYESLVLHTGPSLVPSRTGIPGVDTPVPNSAAASRLLAAPRPEQ